MIDYEELALSFVESEEMRECFRNTLLAGDDPVRINQYYCDIIVGSRASVDKKLEVLRKLTPCKETKDLINAAEIALAERKSIVGDVFLVTMNYPYEQDSKGYSGEKFERQPCLTFDKVMELINKETQIELNREKETIEQGLDRFWYEVEKFIPDENNELVHKISWVLNAKGEIMFFELGKIFEKHCHSEDRKDDDWRAWFHWEGSNNWEYPPIPFDFGDIITIDMRPYYDKLNGVIVRIGDNHDCCSIACVYTDEDGYLYCSTLKHDLHGVLTKVSPLYRAKRFVGELPENEIALKSISESIKKIPSTKRAIEHDRFWHNHELAEQIDNYLNSDEYKRMKGSFGCSWDEFKERFSEFLT